MKKIAFILVFILVLSALAAFLLNEFSKDMAVSARPRAQSATRNESNAVDEVRTRIVTKNQPQSSTRSGAQESGPEGNLFRLKDKIGAFAQFISMAIEKLRF